MKSAGNPKSEIRNSDFKFHVSGFTLVELLVTIGIIAILAAILLPIVRRALVQGEKVKAQLQMSTIVSAIKAYHAEYSLWPAPQDNGWTDHTFGGKKIATLRYNSQVMDCLRDRDGGSNTGHTNNLRHIVFLEVPAQAMAGTDQRAVPNVYTESDGYFLDPWGEPYVIAMDCDFDGEIGISGIEALGPALSNPAALDLQAVPNVQPGSADGGVVPSVTVGVMSYGPDPTVRGSFMFSWGTK